MVQNQKVNIYVQSTPTFARVLFVTKKSIVTHISFKIEILINCINISLVVLHRKHGTETKGDTGSRVTRYCSTLFR